MAAIQKNMENRYFPGKTCVLSTDEESMMNVTRATDASLKKRAGDLVPGDVVCHAGGLFVVKV